MNRPRLIKGLRIAWSVAWGIVCVLVVALWLRSYYVADRVHFVFLPVPLQLWQGNVEVAPNYVTVDSRLQLTMLAAIPHWYFVLLTLTFSVLPWVQWSRRFSLRSLLIIATLLAVVLGLSAAYLRVW